MRYYLAIDIGASSGRHILGWQEGGTVKTEEVYRFANGMDERDGRLVWDMERLEREVKAGLKEALARCPAIESLSIDTWGVDYVLLRGEEPVWPCYAYRDSRTEAAIPQVHERIPFEELYRRTGIQFQPFNTVYQLYADKLAGRLEGVTGLLMVPEYLMWRLTGVMAREYTNATTTGLVNAAAGEYDLELAEKLGLPAALFPKLARPGTVLGPLLPQVAAEVGGQTEVVLCATHDTASAVEGIPMERPAPFISSGTWSLLGVENSAPITSTASLAENFTNEGGYQYRFRFLRNIMGLWMIQSIRRNLDKKYSFAELEQMAKEAAAFTSMVDVNDDSFMNPDNMIEAVKAYCQKTGQPVPETVGEVMQCVYISLADCYAKSIKGLEKITGKTFTSINIVGGGSKDGYLNQLTARASGLTVFAGPTEGTALGNLMVQMITAGEYADLAAARAAIRASFEIKEIYA